MLMWLVDNLIVTGEKPPCDSYDTINPVACFSYISPSSNYTWTTSGTYMDTIRNALSCDSIITVNLIINTVDTTVTLNYETPFLTVITASK